MSLYILVWGVYGARAILGCALLPAAFRLIKGPKAQDRIIALDTLYIIAMLLFATFSITGGGRIYFAAALLIPLVGFVSTIALAKFLMRGEVIE